MSNDSDLVKNFWKKYCSTMQKGNKSNCIENIPGAWGFGDSPEMADDLLAYVVSGEKTATSGMVLDFEHDGDPVPKKGDKSIILNGKKEPKCVIEYINVQQKKFKEVDEVFALKEAEGFKSLQDWRDLHWDFFTRRCKDLGVPLTEEIMLVCMEFKLIYKV